MKKFIYALPVLLLLSYSHGIESKQTHKIKAGNGVSVSPTHGIGQVTVTADVDTVYMSSYATVKQVNSTNTALTTSIQTVQVSTPILTNIMSDLIPDGDNTRKLGSATKHWDGQYITNLSTAGGGGGNTHRDIFHPASSMWADTEGNLAYVQLLYNYVAGGSTSTIWYGRLTNTGVNEIKCDGIMDRNWNGSAFNAYLTCDSSATIATPGDSWIELQISTSQFTVTTIIESTATTPVTAWQNGSVTTTFAVPATAVKAGIPYQAKIRRGAGDANYQDVLIRGLDFDIVNSQ